MKWISLFWTMFKLFVSCAVLARTHGLNSEVDYEMESRDFAHDLMLSTGETNMDDVSFTNETMSADEDYTMTEAEASESGWTLIPGGLKQVSVGWKPTMVWGVNSRDDIYYREGKDGSWQHIGGKLVHISVNGRKGEFVWGVNRNDDIYFREGLQGVWQHVGGKLRQVSVGQSGAVWGVNRDDNIYYRNGFNGQWQGIGGKLVYVSVGGSNGEHVWGVNRQDDIYYRNGVGGGWTRISGKLVVVEVSDRGEVYGVNRAGSIYKRVDEQWVVVPGKLSRIDVGGSRKQTKYVWGVNSKGAIYFQKDV